MSTDSSSIEILDLTKISCTFPDAVDSEVNRENMIATLIGMLKSNSEIVVIEGDQGIGKTTLCAQFARANKNNTFTLFITDSSRYAWDPQMLATNLHDQIQFAVGNPINPKPIETDFQSLLGNSISQLLRYTTYKKGIFYFLIDGLEEIPETHASAVEQIVTLLPIGLSSFRFVLTGKLEVLRRYFKGHASLRPWTLPPFSLDETKKYFSDIAISRENFELVYKLSERGKPGNLAAIRRLNINIEISPDQLLAELSERAPNLFEAEWARISDSAPKFLIALGALCFDSRRHSAESLSAFCSIPHAELTLFVSRCTFLTVSPTDSQIAYVPHFKKFAASKLTKQRKQVIEMAINQLFAAPESDESLTHLPGYLHDSEKYELLLDYLSPDHIGRMIESSQSWLPLQEKTALGVTTARRLNRDGDLMRFGLQRSTVSSLEFCEHRRSEIEAYIALGDVQAATRLAQSAIAKEDRLHLLAIIASSKRRKNFPIEPEMREQIRQLYSQIDQKGLGKRAFQIAADLIYSEPQLAVELIQLSQNTDTSSENRDIAFANLSIKAMMATGAETESAQVCKAVRSHLQNPEVQKFVHTASIVWQQYSASEVINLLSQWEKTSDQIFVMRLWALANSHREDSPQLIEHALNTIIKTTEFAPNSKIYRELATPIPHISNSNVSKSLIARFDGIKSLIEMSGPTEEYVWLQLILARAEVRFDPDIAINRFTDVYYYISYISDLATRTSCLARLMGFLQRSDPQHNFDAGCDLHKATAQELHKSIEQLLGEAADHFLAVESALEVLAFTDPTKALEVALSLNTEPRRNFGLVKIIETVANQNPSQISPAFVDKVLNAINYPFLKSRALASYLKGLSRNKTQLNSLVSSILPYVESSKTLCNPTVRCEILLNVYSITEGYSTQLPPQYLDFLTKELETSWSQVEVEHDRVDIGYRIVATTANNSATFSREFLTRLMQFRSERVLDSKDCMRIYLNCCRLAVRAFSGYLSTFKDTKPDVQTFEPLIERIPSPSLQAYAWCDVAIRLQLSGFESLCRDVVNQYLKPAIARIPNADKEQRASSIVGTAPALFCAHAGTAEEMIDRLEPYEKDYAYRRICGFLLTREHPFEDYDSGSGKHHRVELTAIWDICRLLKKIDADYLVYSILEQLVDNLEHHRRRNTFTAEQVLDIVAKIKDISSSFPKAKFIQHEGYRILAEAQIARIERGGPGVWEDLVKRANQVPNRSDQALILALLAKAMPAKLNDKKTLLFNQAKVEISKLSSIQDRVNRYEMLAQAASDFDKSLFKGAISLALQDSISLQSEQTSDARRRLIDMAYRIDPEFAANLASGSDDDPARIARRNEVTVEVEALRLRDSLQKGDSDLSADHNADPDQYSNAAWKAIRSLNSGKQQPIHIERTRDFVQTASGFRIDHSFAVLSWVVENAVRRYSGTTEASTYLKPFFQAALMGADLAFRIAARLRHQTDANRISATDPGNCNSSLVNAGNHEKAIEKIRQWVRTSAEEFVWICDPYFGPEDLTIVQLIRTEKPEIPIAILTSRKHQQDEQVPQPWDDSYRTYWRSEISESDPGSVKVIIVGSRATGAIPIHDRWCLSKGNGIRLGSSLNSIGISRASEISDVLPVDLVEVSKLVEQYLTGVVVNDSGEKLLTSSFYLG